MIIHPAGRRIPPAGRLAAVVGGVTAVVTGTLVSKGARHGLNAPTWALALLAGVLIPVAIFAFIRHLHSPRSGEDPSVQPNSSDASADERREWIVVFAAIAAGLIALGLFLAFSARPAAAQGAPTQYAWMMMRGNDTIVVERVTRGRTSITGDVTMKGQARLIITAELGDGPTVPTLLFRAWGAGASIDSPPLQNGTQTMTADLAFISVQTPNGERKMSKAITGKPLPLVNNEFAMFELGIQRAKAQGGNKATVPMFALTGGVQLDVSYEFVGDTVSVKVMGQETRFAIDKKGSIVGGLIPGQNITVARVDGAAVDKISIGRPDYSAPAGAPYTAEEVTVKSPAGHVLTGTLTIPKNAKGKVPAVVTITGSGQQDRDEYISLVPGYRMFRQVADTLGRRGIAVLRLDDRGINGSGGEVVKATSADFADDIRAGVAFLRARSDIDGARIALAGHSEGGMIAPLVASTDSKLAAIVLLAGPAYTGRRIIDFQLKNGVMGAEQIPAAKKDSALKAVKAEFDSSSGKLAWMKYFLEYDPVPTAKKVKVPVLILQGGTDQQVTPDQAPVLEQAFKSGGNKDVTMKVFKDRNHLFLNDPIGFPGGYVKLKDGRIDGEVMGTLADWLVAKLKP